MTGRVSRPLGIVSYRVVFCTDRCLKIDSQPPYSCACMRSDSIVNQSLSRCRSSHVAQLQAPVGHLYVAQATMSSTVDQTVLNISPRRERRKYLSWERSKASLSSPRRRSCSLSAAEGPTSGGPQIAVMFDVVTSTRVGRLLRRRFTEVCRRTRRANCAPPSPCEMDGSPTVSSALMRRAHSTACYTDGGTRPQQCSVFAADPRPPPGVISAVTRSTWSGTATRPTNRLITHTADGPSTTTTIVTRTGNTATSTGSLREQITSFFQVSDNKLAMKLFGNKSALEKEKLRHKAVGHWVIHPSRSKTLGHPSVQRL